MRVILVVSGELAADYQLIEESFRWVNSEVKLH